MISICSMFTKKQTIALNIIKRTTLLHQTFTHPTNSHTIKPIFLSTLNNPPSSNATTLKLSITNVEDLEDTGSILSINSKAGDAILLDGDLGAGKTCFARGFVRAKIHDFDALVTSPTFLLSNTYFDEEDDITYVFFIMFI